MIIRALRALGRRLFPNRGPIDVTPAVDAQSMIADAIKQTRFGDIRAVISDGPFDLQSLRYYEIWPSLQTVSWNLNNLGEGTLDVTELVFDGREPPELTGKHLTFIEANTYGDVAVFGAFKIVRVQRITTGFSMDDPVIQRSITLQGLYLAEHVGPLDLEQLDASPAE